MTKQNKQHVKIAQKELKEIKQTQIHHQIVRNVSQEHLIILKENHHALNVQKIQLQTRKDH